MATIDFEEQVYAKNAKLAGAVIALGRYRTMPIAAVA
jgi:hypothetical protein